VQNKVTCFYGSQYRTPPLHVIHVICTLKITVWWSIQWRWPGAVTRHQDQLNFKLSDYSLFWCIS